MTRRRQDRSRPPWSRWLRLAAVASPLAVGACAIPLPMQLASMALNGISYLTTEKSVSDHVITAAVGRDCALHRTVTEGQVCRDEPHDSLLIAALGATPDMGDSQPVVYEPTSLATDWEWTKGSRVVRFNGPDVPSIRLVSGPGRNPAAAEATGIAKDAGLHYVLGSFSLRDNARELVTLVADLEAAVMVARDGGRTVFQVVVGPVAKGDIEQTVSAIVGAGFYDAWPVRLEVQEPDRGIASRPDRHDEDVAS
jgi:hypothetical protein